MIGSYAKSIIHQNLRGAILQKDVSFDLLAMLDPVKGWFEIVKVLYFDLNEVAAGNDEYIDKSSSSVSQLFNNIWLYRYPYPHKVVFEKRILI